MVKTHPNMYKSPKVSPDEFANLTFTSLFVSCRVVSSRVVSFRVVSRAPKSQSIFQFWFSISNGNFFFLHRIMCCICKMQCATQMYRHNQFDIHFSRRRFAHYIRVLFALWWKCSKSAHCQQTLHKILYLVSRMLYKMLRSNRNYSSLFGISFFVWDLLA